MSLPTKYFWLTANDLPLMVQEGIKLYGTLEKPGVASNQTIIDWAAEVGESTKKLYTADSIPWCGLFMALVVKRAKKQGVKDPLWALNWGTFGVSITRPMLGDVLVFVRKTAAGANAGHVGIYVGESAHNYYVLGGNQNDSVTISPIDKKRLYAARRPLYINQPATVTPVIIIETTPTVMVSEV